MFNSISPVTTSNWDRYTNHVDISCMNMFFSKVKIQVILSVWKQLYLLNNKTQTRAIEWGCGASYNYVRRNMPREVNPIRRRGDRKSTSIQQSRGWRRSSNLSSAKCPNCYLSLNSFHFFLCDNAFRCQSRYVPLFISVRLSKNHSKIHSSTLSFICSPLAQYVSIHPKDC